MKKTFTILIAAIAAILMMAQPIKVKGQSVGDVLWAENFSGYSDGNVPTGSTANSHTGTTVYNSGSVTYGCTDGSKPTKIYTGTMYAGGDEPELLIGKGSGTFSISGIPTAGASKITLTFLSNNGCTPSSSTTNVTISADSKTSYSYTITIPSNTATFDIVFTNSSGSNTRVDNFSMVIKTLSSGPSITVNNVNLLWNATSGSFSPSPSVSNPVEGGVLTAATDSDWLSVEENSPYGLTCSANPLNYARKATVTFTYTYNTNQTVTQSVTVTQAANPNGVGSLAAPFTISEAQTFIETLNGETATDDHYVKGIISQIDSYSSDQIQYWISADGTTTGQLEVYNGKGIGGANFTAVGNLQLGNQVTVKGKLKKYNSTYEFAANSSITSYISKSSLTALNYQYGSGPSAAQTINVGGAVLSENLTLSLGENSDFEISTASGSDYTSTINLSPTNNVVANTPIYVRLKAEKAKGNYEGTITVSTTGTISKTVSLSGSVTAATHAIDQYSTPATAHGTITFSPESPVAEGTQVTLTAEPAAGYDFTANSWVFYKESGNDIIVDNSITVTDGNKITMPEYDLYVDGEFTAKQTNAITCVKTPAAGGTLVSDPTAAYDGQTVTLTYTEASGYGLSSIVITKTSDGSVTDITLTSGVGKTFTFTMPDYAVTATATFVILVTDELTATLIGQSGYGSWSGKTSVSEAVYAGYSTTYTQNSNNAIQIKSGDNSGIITTTSGGKAKKVSVTWNSATSSGRTLDIYGKNTAYTATSDLYSNNTSTQGTKLGSIVYGTSTELTINGNYEFIGMRSSSNAMYFDEIEISWAAPTHELTYNANGGSGTMSDPNNPYSYNTSITVLDNVFTAPSGKMFSKWNAESDGSGKDYAPGDTLKMPKHDKVLYAIWENACGETATMAATTGAKQYVNNAGELSFKINLSSSVSALSSCAAITEYGFVYSTSVADPTIGGENCTKIAVGTEYTTVNTEFESVIEGATLGATYNIRSYATNLAGTAYGAKATVPIDADYPSYTISYSTNGEAEASTTKIYQGNAISNLITPTPGNVPAGYTFRGWYGGDYDLSNTPPTFVQNGGAISGTMALKAVFAIATTAPDDVEHNLTFTEDAIASGTGYHDGTGSQHGISTAFTQCLKASGYIQMAKSSGEMHNTTAIGKYIVKIEIDANTNGSNVTVFEGSSSSSITTSVSKQDGVYPFSGNTQFFKVGNNGTYTVVKIKVYYKQTEDVTTYSNYCTSVSGASATSITGGTIDNGHLTTSGTIAEGTAVYLTTPLTINNGVTLTVNGALATDNPAKLIIEDGGQLICSNSVAATVKKSIANANAKDPKNHWYTISSPVHTGSNNYVTIGNETTVNLTNNGAYDMFAYEESSHTWINQKPYNEVGGFDKMYAGQGYMYRNSGNELSFVGNTTVGAVDIALSYTTDLDVADLKGFNLIGNPYTHSIAKGAGKAIDNSKLSSGCYALTNSGTWTIIEDGAEIKPNQGVLVEVSETVADFQIKDINYVAPTPDPGKYKNDNIKFIVESSEYSDAAYAWFDKGIGLTKINHRNENAPMLYIPQDDNNYAIATMTDNTKMFGLNFKAATAGKYTLSYKATGNYNYLHVIDRMTGEDVDMLLEGDYTFIGTPKDSENRFIVHLEYMPNYGEDDNDIFAYQSGSEILVSGQGELQIFDVTGRRVMTTTINGAESISIPAQGVYIFKLNEKVQKIVVR